MTNLKFERLVVLVATIIFIVVMSFLVIGCGGDVTGPGTCTRDWDAREQSDGGWIIYYNDLDNCEREICFVSDDNGIRITESYAISLCRDEINREKYTL